MTELELTGLDGSNPLAFLAALGVVNALTRDGQDPHLRLSWREDGSWRPVLHLEGPATRELVVEKLFGEVRGWSQAPAVQLRYGKKKGGAEAWDLKPPPEVFQTWLRQLIDAAHADDRRALDFAAAFATDVVVDNSGNTKPTALHFTAGQQQFLEMVVKLSEQVTAQDLDEAIFGPWRYQRPLPVLGWDNTSSRDYALRAGDPSKEKKEGVPGADWLAFRGISFLPCVPRGGRVVTTGCEGGWKTGSFGWALWNVPLTRSSIWSLLTALDGRGLDPHQRKARGIGIVFQTRIRRSDQGGYGGFSPARVV